MRIINNTHGLGYFSTELPPVLTGTLQRLYENARGRVRCAITQGHVNTYSGAIICNNCFGRTRRNPEVFQPLDLHEFTVGDIIPLFCSHCGSVVRYIRALSECIECTREFINSPEHELLVIEFLGLTP